MGWLKRVRRIGRITEPAPALPPPSVIPPPTGRRRSLQIRYVDAGSCDCCAIEIGAAFGPVYDAERYGARLVASPRHADALMVTGVVTRNMADPLRNTLAAIPEPRIIIAVGDCACGDSVFIDGYGVVGSVRDVIGADIEIPGCPPRPEDIIAALRSVTRR